MFNKLMSTRSDTNVSSQLSILILRIGAGGLLLTHGIPKLLRVLDGNFGFADPIGLGPELSLILVIFAEVFCAAFVIIGLWTRPALIALLINMVVITFIAHPDDPFSSKELPLFFFVAWITLFLRGPGKYSMDQRLFNKEKDTISQ